jgi:hypothetical protein
MEGSVMNVGMMQREKKKEWIYSKGNVTGSAWSRYKLGQMAKWVIISLNRYDIGVCRFNKNWLASWPVFFIIILPEVNAKGRGCKNMISEKVKKNSKFCSKNFWAEGLAGI